MFLRFSQEHKIHRVRDASKCFNKANNLKIYFKYAHFRKLKTHTLSMFSCKELLRKKVIKGKMMT